MLCHARLDNVASLSLTSFSVFFFCYPFLSPLSSPVEPSVSCALYHVYLDANVVALPLGAHPVGGLGLPRPTARPERVPWHNYPGRGRAAARARGLRHQVPDGGTAVGASRGLAGYLSWTGVGGTGEGGLRSWVPTVVTGRVTGNCHQGRRRRRC